MAGLDGRKIVIPSAEIWNHDWEVALTLCDNEERRQILKLRKLVAELLQGLSTGPATAEHLAWMVFWTRCFSTSKAILAAFDAESELMLNVLVRMCLEMVMQFRLIIDPLSQPDTAKREIKWQRVVERLRAYTAWCLWADRNVLRQSSHPQGLRDVFDTSHHARRLLNNPEALEFVERGLDGGVAVYRVASQGDPAKAKRNLECRSEELDQLLQDQSYTKWVERLRQASNAKRDLNFFEMFEELGERKSMAKLMHDFDMLFAYPLYSTGSSAIHGGSIDQFLTTTTEKSWFPCIVPREEQFQSNVRTTVGWCEDVCGYLKLTRAVVWQIGMTTDDEAGGGRGRERSC